ncbi:MAG: type II toxin-antitoxin system HicB family antitoxin [Actinobacteria bacterium]|nr:type II toxin-antitoxin system HicB family antitoxin [Actinomycetota bacterium]
MARINISLSNEIINKIDRYKEKTRMTRSGFIMKAVENFFPDVERKLLDERKKEAVNGILKIREKTAPLFDGWDSTTEIRKLRDSRWNGKQK